MSNMMTPEMLKSLDAQTIYWDDLNIGDRFVTSGRTVTEADVVNFAGLSADYNSLHIDAEFASKSPHGQRLAHGLLVLAVVSGLTTRHPITKLMEKAIIGLAGL
ncbi:MAG TPA: MaoC/PaaZ C-terminal domain-containing protein, partial [Rhodocyclaceae bacterium]|nr:MaoC/PaaZ C-terminal domain-containing protein [Rhodocyclaceae bacterium]